jgi:adenine-specific DNA-methyltransferase
MPEEIEKLDLASPDLVNENIEKIAALFPNCVTEGADGKVIDLDLLKQELSHTIVEGTKERYRLEWPGKKEAIVTANLPTTKTLRPVRKDSVDFDNTENLYIEGDNLEVLKLLQESYLGKIKMIYIDPPYNTGKDFIYKDNFTEDKEEHLKESGQKDEYNQRLFQNPETAGRYHSDWLSMMYPRLKLARNLLTEDGVIFISIDDNEVDNLKKICDEIFGEGNFIATIIWQKKYAVSADDPGIAAMHDYIICFQKTSFNRLLLPRTDKQLSRYKNLDNDSRGPWSSDNYVSNKSKDERPTLWYSIKHPKTGKDVWPDESAVWRYSIENHKKMVTEKRLYWGPNESYEKPRLKRFLSEIQNGIVPSTWWPFQEVGHNDEGQKETAQLIGKKIFSTPKPVRLLERILEISVQKNDFVLDFFAGSGTVAHAVIKRNAENNSNIKFILVQLAEQTDQKSEAYNQGYENICEIGKERIRRAAKKIKEETKANIDYGFRVYHLDSSNMQDVYYRPQDYQQESLNLFADNVKPDRTPDDLLAQVMLDWGLPLSLKIEQAIISGKKVFKVAENSLYACFDKGIDEDFAKEIAKDAPLRIVFRDSGFKNDTAKTNVKQLLKQLNPETEMKVV